MATPKADARLRAVLLEDDEVDLAVVERELRQLEDLKTDTVQTLAEALQLIGSNEYDLCILDLNVPDSHGIETFRTVAREKPDVPIVVLTGSDDSLLGLQAVREGAQDFLVKGASEPGRLSASVRFSLERQRLINDLRANADELKRSNEELENFAYIASHDLQEPLRMVSAYCSLIKKRYHGKLDRDADEFIDFAVDGADRMSHMIQDLLKFSRVGRRDTIFQDCDAQTAFDIALANLEVSISGTDAAITHDELPLVHANHGQLVQVFQNLIGNGVKFRGEESPRIHVGAKNREVNGEVLWEFSVADNGVGINPDYAERVFEMFHRLDRKTEGNGIGLSICRKIVKRHGGEMWVTPAEGGGSVFRFTLPPASRGADDSDVGGASGPETTA